MKEIKNPLIVEAEHWNKLLEFTKRLSEWRNVVGVPTQEATMARYVLKEIGELE